MSTLVVGSYIGSGAYGQVYQAQWEGRKVAIKKFPVVSDEVRQTSAIQHETEILQRLVDRHIIQFFGTAYHDGHLVLIMDYAEGGSLQRAIENQRVADWPTKTRIAQEVTQGLAYIHHKDVLHRDLKSMNVLLTRHMEVKLCDFGLATVKVRSISRSTSSAKGTTRWMAPELFRARPKYSTKSDMFALGMVMWELAANCTTPFQEQLDNYTVMSLVKSGEREVLPDETPLDYRTWVELCWDQDPDKRPEADEMVILDDDGEDGPEIGNGHGRHLATLSLSISNMSLGFSLSSRENTADASILVARLDDEGRELLTRASADDSKAQEALAERYDKGIGVDQSSTEAFKWYLRAAVLGSTEAQYRTGSYLMTGYGASKNPTMAVHWMQQAAEKGHPLAQKDLGWMYQSGFGVGLDYGRATLWYRKASEQGNAEAQKNLGWMYENGYGVQRNYDRAVFWYRKSAGQENAEAQNSLGVLYRKGYGVEQDYDKAVAWYRKSAEQKCAAAQNNLGWMYQNGCGVMQDFVQAVSWYRKAADQGDSAAQNSLGWMYGNGLGVVKDTQQAIQWYRKAADQGDIYARERLDILE